MTEHRRLRYLLYDYVRGDLDAEVRTRIEAHSAECAACAEDVRTLRKMMKVTSPASETPSQKRGQDYWNSFVLSVESRLQQRPALKERLTASVSEIIRELLVYRRRSAALLAGGLSLGILAGIMLMKQPGPAPNEPLAETVREIPVSPVLDVDRMQRYFRRSRTLLVGIENMNTSDDAPVNFDVERNASRELLREARYLKNQPLDNRSARLIGNLEKILIELANIKEETGLPNVEIVRGGIHQENLLFKIRMAEAIYDTTKFLKLSYTPSNEH